MYEVSYNKATGPGCSVDYGVEANQTHMLATPPAHPPITSLSAISARVTQQTLIHSWRLLLLLLLVYSWPQKGIGSDNGWRIPRGEYVL